MTSKLIGTIVLGMLATSVTLSATENPDRERRESSRKQVWDWTVEERLAVRFDPVLAVQRATAGWARTDAGTTGRPQWGEVHGNENPELFLPGELFIALLGGLHGDTGFRDSSRAIRRNRIIAFGIDDETFWRELESAISSYLRFAARHAAIQQRLIHTLDEGERSGLAAEAERMGPDLCRSRAAALAGARRHFGAETFDRFLYTVVAPSLSVSSGDPLVDTAEHLRFLEGGCQ